MLKGHPKNKDRASLHIYTSHGEKKNTETYSHKKIATKIQNISELSRQSKHMREMRERDGNSRRRQHPKAISTRKSTVKNTILMLTVLSCQ